MNLKDRAVGYVLVLTRSRRGLWGLGVASFLESTVVPIPFETIMIPMMLADRERIWRIATVTTLGCLAGALAGYAFGFFLYETAGRWLIETLGASDAFEVFRTRLQSEGAWLILTVGLTPIPLQVATIGSGMVSYPFLLFLGLVAISRALRYFGLAALTWFLGEGAEAVLKRYGRSARLAFWSLIAAAAVAALVVLA